MITTTTKFLSSLNDNTLKRIAFLTTLYTLCQSTSTPTDQERLEAVFNGWDTNVFDLEEKEFKKSPTVQEILQRLREKEDAEVPVTVQDKFQIGHYVLLKNRGGERCAKIKWSQGDHIGVELKGNDHDAQKIVVATIPQTEVSVGDCGIRKRGSKTEKCRVAQFGKVLKFTFEDGTKIPVEEAGLHEDKLKGFKWKRGYFERRGKYRILKKQPKWAKANAGSFRAVYATLAQAKKHAKTSNLGYGRRNNRAESSRKKKQNKNNNAFGRSSNYSRCSGKTGTKSFQNMRFYRNNVNGYDYRRGRVIKKSK